MIFINQVEVVRVGDQSVGIWPISLVRLKRAKVEAKMWGHNIRARVLNGS